LKLNKEVNCTDPSLPALVHNSIVGYSQNF
jgi:hypothetical protein